MSPSSSSAPHVGVCRTDEPPEGWRERCRQLEAANAAMRAAMNAKGDVLARMSHELRTPLNAVIGFSELLLDPAVGGLDEKQAEYVRDIHRSGRHLLGVINDVLDLAKLEAGAMRLDSEPVELGVPVRQAEEMVRALAARKELRLTTRVEGRPVCSGDLQRLRQVAINLLSNAIKFTPPGGQITATVREAGGACELSVEDTGIGIAPSDHAVIFEEFRQVGHRRNIQEGTGLGLSLVRRFMEQMGGEVSVASELGAGATFTVRLPALGAGRAEADRYREVRRVARVALARQARFTP